MALPLARPSLRRQDFDQVLDAMVHDRLTGGDVTRQLCKEAEKALGLKQASALASVADGVRRILGGLGCVPGDKVVLSPLAPAYWFDGLVRLGLLPVFADVLETSPVLDVQAVASVLTPEVKVIIADCCLGYLPDVEGLQTFGRPVVEDISQGLGGTLGGRGCGTRGAAVAAHFAPETLVAGAGGCLVGFRQIPEGLGDAPSWETLSDLGASLILSQWQDRDIFADKKKEHFRRLFVKLRSYTQPRQSGEAEPVFPWFPILVESGAKDILAYARKHAVEADWAFRNQPYLNQESSAEFCPRSRSFLYRTLIFPLYASISERDLTDLGKVISSLP